MNLADRDQSTKKLWQQGASPIKLNYLTQFAKGQTVLDIGAGYGFYSSFLANQGYSVTSIDLQPRAEKIISPVQARLADLPFGRSFDTVVAFDVLEHEAQEEKALRELRRMTKQRLILSVPNGDDATLNAYNLTFKHHIDKTHQREYLIDELNEKLERLNFRVIAMKKEGGVHPALFAEFFPKGIRPVCRFLIKGLFRAGLLKNNALFADIYAVVEPAD